MIINISKALKLSLVFAVCAGQGVYAMDGIRSSLNHMVPQAKEGLTHAMAFAKSVRGERIVGGLGGATLGLYGVRADCSKKLKAFFVLSGLGVTALSSIRLNPQEPEIPAALFGSVGGALNFLGAQNFNQCLAYGAVAASCCYVNPVLREMITQNLRLAAGFVGAAALGKIAHLKIKDRRAAAKEAAAKEAAAKFNEYRRANGEKIKPMMSQREDIPWVKNEETLIAFAVSEYPTEVQRAKEKADAKAFDRWLVEDAEAFGRKSNEIAEVFDREVFDREALESQEKIEDEALKYRSSTGYVVSLYINKQRKGKRSKQANSSPAGTLQASTPRTGYWNTDLYTLGNGSSLNGIGQKNKKRK